MVPPYSCSLHFSAQISEYKNLIDGYDEKIRKLENENKMLIKKSRNL